MQTLNTSSRPDIGSCPEEDLRLSALHELDLLDTPREETFDRRARLIRFMFKVPVAFISLMDATGNGRKRA